MARTRKLLTYHGRSGHPRVHIAKDGRKYMLVRKKGGGVKRLYEGSVYSVDRKGASLKRLKL